LDLIEKIFEKEKPVEKEVISETVGRPEVVDSSKLMSLDLKFEYGHQLNILKITYELTGISDQQMLIALSKTKGNVEEALGLLF